MRIGLAQVNITWESKSENFLHAENFIRKAALQKCDIIVFPEMFNTGFSMNIASIAEERHGETSEFLSLQALHNNIHIIAGYAAKTPRSEKGLNQGRIYNRQGTCVATYTKLHSFAFGNEDQYFMAGEEIVTFDVEQMASSIFICFDLRFPEVFRRIAKKVKAIFVIANWPAIRIEHWEALLKESAIENQCFVIGVNRIGTDGNEINYAG